MSESDGEPNCGSITAAYFFLSLMGTPADGPFQLTESFEILQNFTKPIEIGGEMNHNAAA